MPGITVKNIPESIYQSLFTKKLKQQAKAYLRNLTLNNFVEHLTVAAVMNRQPGDYIHIRIRSKSAGLTRPMIIPS
jgi:hypothetical protein